MLGCCDHKYKPIGQTEKQYCPKIEWTGTLRIKYFNDSII